MSSLSSDDGSSLSSGGPSSDDEEPEPDENGCATDCCPESPCPIRYFNGEIKLRTTDIESGGFGLGWTHTRTYSNRIKGNNFNRGNGWSWNPENWPYLVQTSYYGNPIALVSNLYRILWFLPNGDGTHTSLYGRLETLEHDSVEHAYRMVEPNGTVWTFNDETDAKRPMSFKSVTTPGGNTTAVNSSADGLVLDVRRSAASGGDTVTESFLYEFATDPQGLPPHVQSVTLRRQVNNGAWQNVSRALYTYYGSGSSFGSYADLETVTRQKWDGAAWANLDVTYYRYWLGTEPNGFKHGLKYVVGPEAYAKLSAVADPLTASDLQVALHADYSFEYDAAGRVTREQINGGSRTFDFAYSFNPTPPPGDRSDLNHWARKTVETRPDGSQTIVFMNVVGMEMLRILKSGAGEWYRFTRYDNVGRTLFVAESSAISSYDETANDLLVLQQDGTFQYLKDTEGLIRLFEYYTTTGSGAAAGYLKTEKLKRGDTGPEVKLREYQYTSHTAGGVTVHPVSKEIVYPDDVDQTRTIETSYGYTFHDGTTQVKEKTTTLPVIPTGQNGSGAANSFVDVFDEFGNLIWHKDERGFLTRYQHNVETGGLVQRIDDVDTSRTSDEPAGWATPAGGGLHLVTDFEHDNLGRTTRQLGPEHTVDLAGTATTVRTAEWTVYKDVDHEVRTAKGFFTPATGESTLVNPVSITKRDRNENVTEEIQAVRTSTSGELTAGDSFPQTSYVRWTTHQYTDCCKLASTRVYHAIPGSGEGLRGTNYDQADFGYDLMDRRNRAVTPGGTIVSTVFDGRDQPVKVYVGTNDTGATESDPTGGGTPGNDMVLVTERQYDGGLAGGDGNLTQVTQHIDASTVRVTSFGYDWRNRQTDADGEVDFYQKTYYDNLDRAIRVDRHNTTAAGHLIGREETRYDDLGRVYQTVRYAVDAMHGTAGSSLVDNTWYDAAGNVSKSQPAGSKLFTKTVYDGLNRPVKRSVGFDVHETSYADAGTVIGDTLLEQNETVYDAAGNAIQSTTRQRYHNATGAGELGSPSSAQPKARVSYSASWPDAIGRMIATADYGTNGGTALSRPATVPARSDTVLVTSTEYNQRGEAFKTIDPAGKEDRQEFDDAGRRVKLIENSVDGDPATGGADEDRTTLWTYTADGQIATLTALNGATGDQVTTYTYGTTLADSAVATSHLLRRVAYPDSTGPSDTVEYRYNRQRERIEMRDQNGTVHAYGYDALGRLLQDRVTTLGTGVDGAVRRIERSYGLRGHLHRLVSYDSPTVGQGNVVNSVELSYNEFGQLVSDQQPGGLVQYGYADGSQNTIRPTSLTYPGGRVISYDYGLAGGVDDAASRIQSLVDGSTALASYSYLGLNVPIEVNYPEPQVRYTLVGTAGGDDPDTGDVYRGLDRFGRVKDCYWYNYNLVEDVDRTKYGYDRASNRVWRENVVAKANGANFDELYAYDGLHRLADMQRGTLDATKTGMTNTEFAQDWSLDATGNWSAFREDADGNGTWDLDQGRTANRVNEISDITETAGSVWATPVYDAAGNMTVVPKPADPTATYTATYDGWNRLVRLDDGSGTVHENEYDGRNFRTVRRVVSGGLTTEERLYCYSSSWQVLEDQEGLVTTNPEDREFVWGLRYIDDLVCRDRTITPAERLYVAQDANWNVTAVMDASGAAEERYAYDGYGVPNFLDAAFAARAGSSYDWEMLYAGYRPERKTGLYSVRIRAHHPALGRWLMRDPADILDSTNFYEYVSSGPVDRVDPYGLSWWEMPWEVTKGFGYGMWQGARGLVVGAAKMLYEIPASAIDFGGISAEAVSRAAFDTNWSYTWNLSSTASSYDPVTGRAWYVESGHRALETGATIGTLGGYQIGMGVYEYSQTGDADALSQRMGGVAFANLCGARMLRGTPQGNLPIRFRGPFDPGTVRMRWNQSQPLPPGTELSHWLIPRNQWGRRVPDFVKNRGWNLRPMRWTDHALNDPMRMRFVAPQIRVPTNRPYSRFVNRTPECVPPFIAYTSGAPYIGQD